MNTFLGVAASEVDTSNREFSELPGTRPYPIRKSYALARIGVPGTPRDSGELAPDDSELTSFTVM